MAKQTLTVQLMHANAHIADMHNVIDASSALQRELYAEIAELKAQIALGAKPVLPLTNARIRVRAACSSSDFTARLAAAREEAMRTGRCVKV